MPALNRSYNCGVCVYWIGVHTLTCYRLVSCTFTYRYMWRHTWRTCRSVLFSVILWSFMADFPFQLNQVLGTVPHVSRTEMVVSMKKVAGMNVELTVEERNLLSVAYKNVIGARRASWRIISSIEQRQEGKNGEEKMKMIQEYRQTVKPPKVLSFSSVHQIFYSFQGHTD